MNRDLFEKAKAVRDRAHTPYSKFNVGAAIVSGYKRALAEAIDVTPGWVIDGRYHHLIGYAIWDKADDFKAATAKFAADVKAAQDSTKDLDTFKANVATVGKNCSNCHQTFRVRPS